MVKRRVVVTGMGIVSAIGVGRKKFWSNVLKGACGIKRISIFRPFSRDYNFAYGIRDSDCRKYLGQERIGLPERSTKFLLIAAKLALKDIKFNFHDTNNSDIGVVIGTDWGYLESNFRFHNLVLTKGPNEVNPIDFPPTIANYPASQVSIRYGLSGLNATIARGFVSGIDAIGYAINMIQKYGVKNILTGAVESLSKEYYALFYKTGWLKNFKKGKQKEGIVLGEGACVLVLEEMQSARRRNADILAEVVGYGFSFGDNKKAMRRSMLSALGDAKLKPENIDYVSINANGHVRKDRDEVKVMDEMFGNKHKPIMGAIKPMTGECLGVSGVMQAAASCLSMSEGVIAPNIFNRKIKKKINIAMINSFGLDGNNSCLILKKPFNYKNAK